MGGVEKAQWIELYHALEKPLYNVVYRIIWDAAESQDIVQEAFLRCWRRKEDVRADGVEGLLFRTALNLASNRRRSVKLWRLVGLGSVPEIADERACGDAISRPVRDAFEALPEQLKHVLLLTEIAGMTYGEIAATLGVREGTVGSRRTRALAMLRERLAAEGVEADER